MIDVPPVVIITPYEYKCMKSEIQRRLSCEILALFYCTSVITNLYFC